MTPNDFFDAIFLINLARREDRMAQAQEQFWKHGIKRVTLFNAHDMPGDENRGCTSSHRGVLELICHHGYKNALILEDDFLILHENFNELFADAICQVPQDWAMLYLGGHYAEDPLERMGPKIIRCGHMKTTSSYAVTNEMAHMMAPHIYGVGPIDELYCAWNRAHRCYVMEPRLMVQREGYSDLQHMHMNNGGCMQDPWHVYRLDQLPQSK